MIQDFLQRTFLGNTVESYYWFAGIIIVGLIFMRVLSKLLTFCIFRFLKKYSTGVGYDKLLELLKKPLRLFIILLALYFSFDRLHFPDEWHLAGMQRFGVRVFLYRSFQVSIVVSVTWIVLRMADFFGLIMMYRASLTETKSDLKLHPG